MKFILGILSIVFGILSCTNQQPSKEMSLPHYNDEMLTPLWEQKSKSHQIGAFKFLNQEGKLISNESFKNKIYVANFFFTTCPGICPKMSVMMGELQSYFIEDDEIGFLSHSVTPELDSVPVLKAYSDNHGIINDKWHLVTGERSALYQHARSSYFADEDFGKKYSAAEDFIHTENFYLIDKKQRIRGVYNGTLALEMNRIKEDIALLKTE